MRELVLVKWGGSLLTDKRRSRTAHLDVIQRLAHEIAAVDVGRRPALVLGHGSGSFGHVEADRHGLRGASSPAQPASVPTNQGVSAVHHAASLLHRQVVDALADAGLAPFSQAPSSMMVLHDGRPRRVFVAPMARALDLGLLPVTYGDVVVDRCRGAAIASTESVLQALAPRLRRWDWNVTRVLWLGATAGVRDEHGNTVTTIDERSFSTVRRWIGATAGTDVTGGMLLRLQTARVLARKGIESWIVDGTVPGLLTAALRGEIVPGTRFLGS